MSIISYYVIHTENWIQGNFTINNLNAENLLCYVFKFIILIYKLYYIIYSKWRPTSNLLSTQSFLFLKITAGLIETTRIDKTLSELINIRKKQHFHKPPSH